MAIGLGVALAGRLAPGHGPATRLALAFLVGTALLSYAVLALGLAGGLRPLPVLGLLAALSVPLVRERRRIRAHVAATAADLRAAYAAAPAPERALLVLAGLSTGLGAVVPLLPVTNADALAYATSVPWRFAQDGRMQFYPDSYETAFVLLVETLHTVGYTLGLRPLGPWFEVAAQALLLFAAADCYRALWGDGRRGSAYLFGTALLLMPLVQLLPFMTKAHLVELLAIVVALTLVLEAPARGGWAGAAACVGVAVATKYIAGIGIVALLAPAVVLGLRRLPRPPRARELVGAALVAGLLAAPFYLRNLAWTGSPLFPLTVPGFASPFALRSQAAWLANVYHVDSGYGRAPSDLLLWWPRASILPIRGSASYIGTFALALLPLALVARPRPRRLLDLGLGFLSATLALFVLSAQFERYYLAPLAAMTALAVAGWDAQRARASVYWAGVVLLLSPGLLALTLKGYGLLVHAPALLSRAGEARVLDRTTPWYADYEAIRLRVPATEPILCLLRNCQYLANHRRDDVLHRLVEASEDAGGEADPRLVWRGLRAQGIRHVVTREPDAAPTVVGWLARCGGRVVYRNPAARFGTRDPRLAGTQVVVLIELVDTLDDRAAECRGQAGPS